MRTIIFISCINLFTLMCNGHESGVGHCAGVGLNKDEEVNFTDAVLKNYQNGRLHVIRVVPHGFSQDLLESGLERMGVRTDKIKVMEAMIGEAVQDSGGMSGINHYVTADFYGNGGSMLANTRKHLKPQIERMLFISTYAADSSASPKGVAYAMNFANIPTRNGDSSKAYTYALRVASDSFNDFKRGTK